MPESHPCPACGDKGPHKPSTISSYGCALVCRKCGGLVLIAQVD